MFKTCGQAKKACMHEKNERGVIFMKKFGTRLISAVLAGCMMTSVLPVSAFALEGSTEFERTVSAQENSDASAEPSGEGYPLPTDSATTINKDFIADHGKVYSMSGTYTEGIVIDAEDEDVVINVTGETTFDKGGNRDDYATFITVRRAKSVTVNAEGQTITIKAAAKNRAYTRCFYAADTFTGTAELNGGTYNMQCDDIAACYLCGGDWTFNNLTMNAVLRAIETDRANVTVNGGSYDCSYSTSATFWIQNSPNSSFNYVTASGEGWVLNAIDNSVVDVVGGSYSRNPDAQTYKDRPTLRVANNATLNVRDADVTGTYCDVFVTNATANLFGGTYTNTNQYSGCKSPALKVWNGGTLNVNGATVECKGDNAAISSGEPAGSYYHYKYGDGGKLVVENCTIKNSKYGIYLGRGSSTSAELKSAEFEGTESDIYLESDKEITISDTFTTQTTIKVADPEEGRQLTVAGNANKLHLKGQNESYRVAYDKAQHYYYLTQRAPGYTLTAKDATATIKVGGVDTKVDPNDEIYEGTPVTLTADPAPDGQKFAGWTGIVILNGVVQNDLLKFPNEEDQTKATFDMPAGNVTVRAVYEAVDPVEPPVDPVDPVDPVGPVDPVLPGVIIGGAVILGAYETGTGIYRLMNMQGIPLPSNRIELAELVWERAGKPEPQNMTDEDLYADIDADDTDAQKAAHWMVEQELMKFDEDNNKFHPCFPVSKLRVCLTWQNAKDKGLID